MNISVIIPVLNEEKVIERNLIDLNKNLITETIVSDGGSSDATVVIASRFAKVVHSNPGRGTQMDLGAKAATSDILLFLHADTILPDQWRDRILSSMANEDVVGGAFSLSIDSDRLSRRIIAAVANLRSRFLKLPYGDQGIFVRRSVFEKLGGFKDIPVMEDVDLMRRLKKSGKVVILGDKVKTSARRWEREGVLYSTARNLLMLTLYYIGVAPERLCKLYKAVR